MTDAEAALWERLRRRQLLGHKFRRQQIFGQYIVDFVCLDKRLIIEVDGGQHATQTGYDDKRMAWLEKQGFRVLRFWNNEVFSELEAVMQTILDALTAPPPSPSPADGGRESPLARRESLRI